MYLKRMELHGFKSFTNKTKIVFEPGISCIVGPNGSGKSNISDALRWVMGEQSARNIRGGKLEDVIFAGTKKRRPQSMAEVTLVLDNSDGYLPLEYSEVEVTRRAIRNGASEYEINGAPCRLKDIRDLFVDTGVGVDGISLIDQGRINEMVACRPDERRTLVEEAAGIVKYRDRKKEACRKLADTEQNLDRIGDIISELSDRLGPLGVQAEKAKKYLKLKEEFDRMEIGISVRVLSEAEEKIAALNRDIDEREGRLMEQEGRRLSAQAEVEALRLKLSDIDREVTEASKAYYDLQTALQKAEGDLQLAQSRKENADENLARYAGELEALERSLSLKKQEEAELSRHIEATASELAAQEESLLHGEGGKLDLRSAVQLREEKLAELQNDAQDQKTELAAIRSALEFRQEMAEKNRLSQEKLTIESESLVAEISDAEEKLAEAMENNAAAAEESRICAGLVNDSEKMLKEMNQLSQDKAAEEAEFRYKVRNIQTRVAMLTDMMNGYEGFYPGVKGLMRACREGKGPKGIVGVFSELIDVPEQYRVAVEAYLGASLQNIITEDAASAKEAVAYLKKNQLGRATFLPLDILQVREARDFSAAERVKGVFGRGSDLVQCDKKYRPAVEFLLNNVVFCDNMDTALDAAKGLKYKSSVVTLDGDMVNPGAAVTGGSRNAKAGEILSQKGKLDAAKKELAEAEAVAEAAAHALEEVRAKLRDISETNDNNREKLRALSQIASESAAAKELQQARLDSLLKRADAIKEEQAFLAEEAAGIAHDLEQAREAEQDSARKEQELSALVDAEMQLLNDLQKQMEDQAEDITTQKMALATSRQKLHGQNLTLERLQNEISALEWDAEGKDADRSAAERESKTLEAEILRVKEESTQITSRMQEAEARVAEIRQGHEAETSRLQELEKEERELFRLSDKERSEVTQLQIKRERWLADLDNETKKLETDFQMDLAMAKAHVGDDIPARTVMISRSHQLKREINALGNVNVDAIEEYEKDFERHSFMTAQRNDMLEAKDKLNGVIREMDHIMTGRFRKTFDQLNDAFAGSFRRLFGGGEASLYLTEPENILETGVDISVHPPGKKVTNHNLLSGGEKSLIGMALMFATLAVRPTPFCFMDEVDAALDEANIDRFTAYLRDESDESQFVMITHRQNTMDAADALWGVTMEEEGVSKVIGVRLTQALEA